MTLVVNSVQSKLSVVTPPFLLPMNALRLWGSYQPMCGETKSAGKWGILVHSLGDSRKPQQPPVPLDVVFPDMMPGSAAAILWPWGAARWGPSPHGRTAEQEGGEELGPLMITESENEPRLLVTWEIISSDLCSWWHLLTDGICHWLQWLSYKSRPRLQGEGWEGVREFFYGLVILLSWLGLTENGEYNIIVSRTFHTSKIIKIHK